MDSTAAPVPIDELLAHRAWLGRIARALVGDPQTADDLMQEVWLAALERPPKNRRSLRGWLATVLRRKAMDKSRAAGRRAHYETGRGPPGPTAPADELIGEIEMHRRVTDAVLSLEEPYRSALLLRYVGDRPVDEVARLQDAPVATVRTRLKRGLALLRKRLDAGHGGRRDEWVCLLVPIAWPDKAIWVSKGATAAAVGGGIMGTKMALLAGAIIATLIATWAVLGSRRSETASGEGGVETALDRAESPLRTGDTKSALRGRPARAGSAAARGGPRSGWLPVHAPRLPPEEPAPVDGDATAKTTTLRVFLGDGELTSGRVRVQRLSGSDPGGAVEHVIARDGTVHILTNHNVVVDVSVDGRQGRRLRLGAGSPEAPVDVVFGTGEIFGVVRDEQGLPDERVGVQVSSDLVRGDQGWAPSAEGHVFSAHVLTDAEGAYWFTDLPTGNFALVASRGKDDPAADRNIRRVRVNLKVGERVRVDLGGVYVEPLLTGVLRYSDGVAVAKQVAILLTAVEGGGRLYVSTDAEGRYSKRVPPAVYEVELVIGGMLSAVWRGARFVPTAQRVAIVDENTPPQDITFPGTRLEGRVQGLAGQEDQEVTAYLKEPVGGVPVSRISKEPVRKIRAYVTKDGTFLLDGLSPGLWRLTGSPRMVRPVEIYVDERQSVLPVELEYVDE